MGGNISVAPKTTLAEFFYLTLNCFKTFSDCQLNIAYLWAPQVLSISTKVGLWLLVSLPECLSLFQFHGKFRDITDIYQTVVRVYFFLCKRNHQAIQISITFNSGELLTFSRDICSKLLSTSLEWIWYLCTWHPVWELLSTVSVIGTMIYVLEKQADSTLQNVSSSLRLWSDFSKKRI